MDLTPILTKKASRVTLLHFFIYAIKFIIQDQIDVLMIETMNTEQQKVCKKHNKL